MNADRVQYVRSSSGPIAIVVMTLYAFADVSDAVQILQVDLDVLEADGGDVIAAIAIAAIAIGCVVLLIFDVGAIKMSFVLLKGNLKSISAK